MRVLHVYRGYGDQNSNPVVMAQINSLHGRIDVIPFPIKKGGMSSYLQAVFNLRKYLKKNSVNLIHAHYSYCGFSASLTFFPNIVCSLMGSDLFLQKSIIRFITLMFQKLFWKATIVKSEGMRSYLRGACVIANGVDLSKFIPMPKVEALKNTDLDPGSRNVIFVATDVSEAVKNYALARDAVAMLNDDKVKLVPLSSLEHDKLIYYYNAADLLLLTSLSEGSPNVIKEAMACNCPIVATDVGDVSEVIADAAECHVTGFDADEIATKIRCVLKSERRSNGRERIHHLDSALIADQLIQLYRQVAG